MLKKLRIQFVCFMMTIATVMLCIISVTVYGFTSHNLERTNLQKLETISTRPILGGIEPREERESYLLFHTTQSGWVSRATGTFASMDSESRQAMLQAALEAQENSGILEDYGLRFLINNSQRRQTVAFLDISTELSALRLVRQICLVIGCVSWLLFLAISFFLAKVTVQPVEKAWKQQHQFVADASHELKTPLTVIMTNAELLQDEDYSQEEKQRFSENILTVSQQMRGLVNSLLELARVDNGAIHTAFHPISLSEAVSDGVLPFEPLFFEKDLQLQSIIEPDIFVRGSATHLQQVVEILLDNAMKYSQPGQVDISLRKSGTHCILTVSNPGDPIPKEDLAHLFERFYRRDKSRSRDGSYGLGLSIAHRIVQEHHGKIWAESIGGNNRFHVALPLATRPHE